VHEAADQVSMLEQVAPLGSKVEPLAGAIPALSKRDGTRISGGSNAGGVLFQGHRAAGAGV
jgi:hypothetical protein